MEDIKKIYNELTQVNIDEQRRIWDERGKGYYGEYLVFEKLFFNIDSPCKFLMNLEIPTENGKTTEIDLLMIHTTGIYVFEIKHYKGTIYGDTNGEIWTQFFRTQKNNVFKNPVLQNAYHLKALKKLFPNTDIFSVIVFTNPDCDIKVKNDNNSLIISELNNLSKNLNNNFYRYSEKYSINDIDKRFFALLKYSKLIEKKIEDNNGIEIPFYDYFNILKKDYESIKSSKIEEYSSLKKELEQDFASLKTNLESEYNNKHARLIKDKKRNLIVTLVAIIICVIFTFLACSGYKQICNELVNQAENERNLMEQNFQEVDETNIPYNDIINNIIKVDATLKKSTNINNAVLLNANLSLDSKKYGIQFNENSKYIVIKKDGTSYEYDVFNTTNIYYSHDSRMYPSLYKERTLKEYELIGIGNANDIAYIKMTNVTLFDATNYSYPSYADNLELEIYSAE